MKTWDMLMFGFRSILLSCIQHIHNMHLSWGFYHSLQHLLACLWSAQEPTVCKAGVEIHAQKEKPTSLVGRWNTLSFKHYERRRYRQGFGCARISQHPPFQEGGCVCLFEYARLHVSRNISGIFCFASHYLLHNVVDKAQIMSCVSLFLLLLVSKCHWLLALSSESAWR